MPNEKQTELTADKAREIIGAIARLGELGSNIIVDASTAAERQALKKWLGEALVEHSGELMGCWVAIRQEYEPLVNALAGVLPRALAITQKRQQRLMPSLPAAAPVHPTPAGTPEPPAAAAEQPSNIVPLTQ
jgi:hypothetical protein